jgi:hypothetical protein
MPLFAGAYGVVMVVMLPDMVLEVTIATPGELSLPETPELEEGQLRKRERLNKAPG